VAERLGVAVGLDRLTQINAAPSRRCNPVVSMLCSTMEVEMIRDDELRAAVVEELEWEPSVDAAHVGVACRDGVVTLTGHVDSYAEKTAAERAARRVRGVRAIALDIAVRLPSEKKTADDEIAARALKILEWDVAVPSERLQVEVEDGVVALSGTLDWQYQKAEAEADIRKLTGVKGVVNAIVVAPRVRAGDVRSEIGRAFRRTAELDAAGVTVAVENGRVTLGGRVNTWQERDTAERAAWSAPGVIAVEDHIVIGHP
jgi:osmotically-inducible protein OsmY